MPSAKYISHFGGVFIKKTGILLALLMISPLFFVGAPVGAGTSSGAYPDYTPVDWRTRQAGAAALPTLGSTSYDGSKSSTPTVENFESTPPIGTKAWDWLIEWETASGDGTMTLRAISGNVEIWTADDLSFLPGDPRNVDPYNTMVTDEMCQYLAEEFNSVIYSNDTTYFGTPNDRYGNDTLFEYIEYPEEYWNWTATENGQRIMVKVYNIVDDNYYDPSYPSYVAGFFSPTYNYYYDRNIIHIDCWRWYQRLGDYGAQWLADRPDLCVTRPHVYESTAAHEFQHNIHDDLQPYDELFINEGCSMYAELLCGYGIDASYLNSYFATPDNSLTLWGDQGDINILADYGAAALFTVYLSDHYGGSDLISYFMQQGIPGIDGINNALSSFGYSKTFDGVFHDWKLANLIRSDNFGLGKYNYRSLDLNAPDIIPVRTYTVSGNLLAMAGSQFNSTITYFGDDTGISLIGPYGSDYIRFTDWSGRIGRVSIAGSPYAVYGWRYNGYWYSGTGSDLADVSLTCTAYVDPSNPTLTFSTKYDIEEGWDFGFVQVSTDGGSTWASLANEYTTCEAAMDAHPTVIENLPGLTGTSPGFPGWMPMSFDLSAHAGQTVMISLRYVTDWYTTNEGWYVNDVKVSGSFVVLQGNDYPAADFEVSMVQAVYLFGRWRYLPVDVPLNRNNVGSMAACAKAPSYVVLVVTPIMEAGATDYLISGGSR